MTPERKPALARCKRPATLPHAPMTAGFHIAPAPARSPADLAAVAGLFAGHAARRIRYRELRLDTRASMTAARALYGGIGFEPIDPYYAPTPEGTVFMGLALQPGQG